MASTSDLLSGIAAILNGLPDVFSTAQWGGRAYKLPGPDGSTKKPKLLAFVSVSADNEGDDECVSVVFKLPKERSDAVTERFDWIGPFNFGNWKRSGWIAARLTDGRQLRAMKRLLGECRELFPTRKTPERRRRRPGPGREDGPRSTGTHPVVRRIDRVMAEARKEGWRPMSSGDDREA